MTRIKPSASSPVPPGHGRYPRLPRARRRLSRAAFAAGVAVALAATGAVPAFAAAEETPQPALDKPAEEEKYTAADLSLIKAAEEAGDPHVTLLIAAEPGETGDVAKDLDAVAGTSIGYTEDSVGYVRANVTTAEAKKLLDKASGNSDVFAIDVSEMIEVPDPIPGLVGTDRHGKKQDGGGDYTGPDADTPADNPYMPTNEIGTVDFIDRHPSADGRGITIGVIDTGVDLFHPALQETTTGERKIVDWVTATDPIFDGDLTWRPMVSEVSGGTVTYAGREYTVPEGDYYLNVFRESATAGGDMNGDMNLDGDTTDFWGLLYDPAAGSVTVDINNNGDFSDDEAMTPYADDYDVATFGEDDPATDIVEEIPFVVEIRKDVPMDPYGGSWVGQKRDFVNIGVIDNYHGTHVAGITAGHSLFGGEMQGAAPGAQIVSSRACIFGSGCSSYALTEGMIDLVVNRGVDVVNMSIGGLPVLNDGNNARARLYTELIDTYGVQLVISAGNEGPGINTIGDPALADKVLAVGAGVSKETWEANYGSVVDVDYALFPFSSRGPRADGDFQPDIVAPGAAISAIPMWQEGSPVPQAGYELPPGYGMANGTSMSSPQAAGAVALLLSAAERYGLDVTPAELRTAIASSAKRIKGEQAYEQGGGLMNTPGAWYRLWISEVLRVTPYEYQVQAPVDHVLSEFLATPHTGTGIYDRETAPGVGESETYEVTFTRTTGPDYPVYHPVSLTNNAGKTFSVAGPKGVWLSKNKPATVKIKARPKSTGVHSALIELRDLRTGGKALQTLATIVVPVDLDSPDFAAQFSDSVKRNNPEPYYVRVPEGAGTLEVAMSGLAEGSQARWLANNPYGYPVDNTQVFSCYNNYEDPRNTCRPDVRSYDNPIPGVWELNVDARRTSPYLDQPYTLDATVYGATFDPAETVVEDAPVGEEIPLSWEIANHFAPVTGTVDGGDLGSVLNARPTVGDNEYVIVDEVVLDDSVSFFEVEITNPADTGADLDLYVYRDGELVDQSTSATSDEYISFTDPEPGTYTVEVHGWSVPEGSTEYDFSDGYYSPVFGSVSAEGSISLGNGESGALSAGLTLAAGTELPEGRDLFASIKLRNERGTAAGSGDVLITSIAQ
ncbi:S8 family serine peptidase [Streptomyces aidingensis]|uniref:Pre-peptidase C-terminal domain-containing protein n=1 Tax=Streptomyces aidingensis TaxID=910347 RepID=A0A1I1FDD4_9ACTN|nr:pre-peptidase C-terminal domain-containing protein [Streptomyces aidingensis]